MQHHIESGHVCRSFALVCWTVRTQAVVQRPCQTSQSGDEEPLCAENVRN